MIDDAKLAEVLVEVIRRVEAEPDPLVRQQRARMVLAIPDCAAVRLQASSRADG